MRCIAKRPLQRANPERNRVLWPKRRRGAVGIDPIRSAIHGLGPATHMSLGGCERLQRL